MHEPFLLFFADTASVVALMKGLRKRHKRAKAQSSDIDTSTLPETDTNDSEQADKRDEEELLGHCDSIWESSSWFV